MRRTAEITAQQLLVTDGPEVEPVQAVTKEDKQSTEKKKKPTESKLVDCIVT